MLKLGHHTYLNWCIWGWGIKHTGTLIIQGLGQQTYWDWGIKHTGPWDGHSTQADC